MKTCEVCGKEFMCFPENCWCKDHDLTKKQLMLIYLKHDNCLCPECIKGYEEKKSSKES